MMLTLNRMPQVVIAKVQGIATAAGCQLVASCDLAVASSTAKFATSGINVGLFCSTPAVAVSRNLSPKQAFEMLITGEFIDAETAAAQGLINRVAAPEDLDKTLQTLIDAIISKSPVATATGKQMFYNQLGMSLPDAYDYASQVMVENMMADDVAEGIDALLRSDRRFGTAVKQAISQLRLSNNPAKTLVWLGFFMPYFGRTIRLFLILALLFLFNYNQSNY